MDTYFNNERGCWLLVTYSHCNFKTATKGIQSGLPPVHSFQKYLFLYVFFFKKHLFTRRQVVHYKHLCRLSHCNWWQENAYINHFVCQPNIILLLLPIGHKSPPKTSHVNNQTSLIPCVFFAIGCYGQVAKDGYHELVFF